MCIYRLKFGAFSYINHFVYNNFLLILLSCKPIISEMLIYLLAITFRRYIAFPYLLSDIVQGFQLLEFLLFLHTLPLWQTVPQNRIFGRTLFLCFGDISETKGAMRNPVLLVYKRIVLLQICKIRKNAQHNQEIHTQTLCMYINIRFACTCTHVHVHCTCTQ